MNSSVSEYSVESTLATHVKVTEAMEFTSGVRMKMLFLLNTHVESTESLLLRLLEYRLVKITNLTLVNATVFFYPCTSSCSNTYFRGMLS